MRQSHGRAGRGIIPADAGSTRFVYSMSFDIKDHPRGCGEHNQTQGPRAVGRGSSPRMRGALASTRVAAEPLGIIPADAGSTHWCSWACTVQWDHPRGCGEHHCGAASRSRQKGSSPRMRGALLTLVSGACGWRIIPADAGSTQPWPDGSERTEDHPRGCGEHHWNPLIRPVRGGSSPRMRGARYRNVLKNPQIGIIPADAGSTLSSWTYSFRVKDHPRGCGEHRYA